MKTLLFASILHQLENWVGGVGSRLAEAVDGASAPTAVAIFFAAGVLTSLTPCVYPMIPIVIGYMGGVESQVAATGPAAAARRKVRVFSRALSYVLGMAAVYTGLGVVALMTGRLFGASTQTFWGYAIVGVIIIAFALSLFGLYEIRLPTFISRRLGSSPRQGLFGALVMGATSAIVAAPCAAPIVAPLTVMLARDGRVVYGTIAMFAFSLGMGMLLMLLGIFSGLAASVPRPGNWMVTLKKIMGLFMVLVGAYFIYKGGSIEGWW